MSSFPGGGRCRYERFHTRVSPKGPERPDRRGPSMIESIRNAYALPDLRRRILYTILVLVIYRLVANIPAPGVNLAAWLQFTSGATTGNRFLDVLDLLSGGAVRNFSVMAMGVYPYITASIILQLLTPLIPQLEELQAEGESGRNKITRITYF